MRNKYIRFFISSTFADMKVERDLLQEVFNEIIPIYLQKGWQIETVDLRWGISTEAGYHNKTMQICKQELMRCQRLSPKPNFIILLGNRYGWIPLPEIITKCDYEKLEMTKDEKKLFYKWYNLDTNALPDGQYLLKARTGEFRKDNIWKEQAEKPLKEMFYRNSKPNLTLFQRIFSKGQSQFFQDYTLSATEQEILLGALNVHDADEHVIAYFRNLTNIPNDKQVDFVESNKEYAKQLKDLKKKLCDKLSSNNVYSISLSYTDYIKEIFAQTFKQKMRKLVTNIIEQTIDDSIPDTTNSENALHLAIAAEEADGFVGREAELSYIDSYLQDKNSFRALWIKSPSGAGKSALLAKVVETYKEKYHVICRFCGRSLNSSSAICLLRSLWWNLQERDSKECSSIKKYMDFPARNSNHKSWECLKCKLKKLESDTPILVVIDAINQVEEDEDGFSLLKWLDCQLAPSVKVIISSTDELRYSFVPEHITIYSLHDMGSDAWIQVQQQLSKHKRKLTQTQKEQVMGIIEQSDHSAIFLDVLGKYLCNVTSTTELSNIPHTLTALAGHLLDNLSRPENHGPLIVRKVMSLLVSDRIGLSQTEILDLMSHDDEIYAQIKADSYHDLPQTGERHIPPILWSRLQSDLDPLLRHLTTKAGQVMCIFHSELRQAIANNYLNTQKEQILTFQSLYQYYRLQINRKNYTPHALLEVIYCGIKLMDYTRKYDKKTFQSIGIDIYHLLIDNAQFLTVKALRHMESLLNDYLLAMPYYFVKDQQMLISVQRKLMRAADLTDINDEYFLAVHSNHLPNEEHFLCYLKNLPSAMPLKKTIENLTDKRFIMENTLIDCDIDKDDGTLFVIPELGEMPRMSADGTKVASLFENNHQIKIVDLHEPLNCKQLNVTKQILDIYFSLDMHYAAIRTEDSCILYDTINYKNLIKKKMSTEGDITLSDDGHVLATFNNGEIELVDLYGNTLFSDNNLLSGKTSPSGKYIWFIDDSHILHRYDYENEIDIGIRTFNPNDINQQICYNSDEQKKQDPRPTRIFTCSDTCCAVDHKNLTCSVVLKEETDRADVNYYTINYLVYGKNNDILFNRPGYLLCRNHGKDYESQDLQIDLPWSCASPDLSIILSKTSGDRFARIVDVRNVKQSFNSKSSSNNGVNSLTCSYDGHKIWVAYGLHFDFDHQKAIVRVINGQKTAWVPPIDKDFHYIAQVSSSPDGSLLALSIQHYLDNGGCEFMVITHDNKTIIRQNTGDSSAIGIAFSEDGRYILAKTGHLISDPEPTIFLFNNQGKKIYENSEHINFSSKDFICFSRNNRYALDGYGNLIDLLEPTISTKRAVTEPYSIAPLGMMAIRIKYFLVQPPVANGFLSNDTNSIIFFNHLESDKRSVFKLPFPYHPIACSPSGRFIYLHYEGVLYIWDWIGTQLTNKLMDHVQWIVPALDDNHIYVIRDDYMILLLNITTNKVEQKAFMGRTIYQQACAQGLAVTNDYCEVALLHPDPSLNVNTPAPTTFVRHWNLEQHKLQPPIAVCPACGHHISMSKELAKILKPTPDNFEDIHRKDWDDSRLYGYKCPHCQSSLSFNPYIL